MADSPSASEAASQPDRASPKSGDRPDSGLLLALEQLAAAAAALEVGEEELSARSELLMERAQEIHRAGLHYRHLFEHGPDALLVTDAQGQVLHANLAASELLGRRRERIAGRALGGFLPGGRRRAFRRWLAALVEAGPGRTGSLSLRLRPHEGAPQELACSARVMPDREGASGREVLWVLRDGARQREAEEHAERAARAEAARDEAQHVLERITDGFIALDRQGRFTYVNRSAEEILGRARAELLGRTAWVAIPEAAEGEMFRRFARVMLEQEPTEFEADLRGRRFHLRLFPSSDGLSVYFLDVTERRAAEAALRESEERFRLIVEGSEQVFFYVHDVEGRFTYVSPSVRSVLGYAPEDLLGRPYRSIMDEDASDPVVDAITQMELTEGVAPLPYTGSARHHSGRPVLLELVEGPVLRGGAVVAIQGFARDVTHRQHLEEERERLLAKEQQARREAEAAARYRDEVLAVVSHDLRNPLNAILLQAGVLMEVPLTRAQRQDRLSRIVEAAGMMHRLIQGLLDTARLEAGRGLPIHPEPVAAAELLREIALFLQAHAEDGKVRLDCDLPEEGARVLADRDRVLQVLWNLAGNAVKFTPPGGRVRLEAFRSGPDVVFVIEDSGPGIAEEDLPRLFDPFWQAKRTARLGAGLGLPISRAIIEAHGGSVRVRSRVGEGTAFAFTLPAVDTPT